jgi:hypothetical protein
MRALVALLDVAAQCGSAAGADVTESLPLWWGDDVAPLLQEFLSILAKDIGHFEPMFSHRLLPSPSGVKPSRIARSSKGLCVACTLRTDTWR